MEEVDEPRWLDSDEQEAWLGLTGVLIRLPAALGMQLQRDAGISHLEYQVLAGLSIADDRTLRMSNLATFVEGSPARLSQVVGRLDKRAWFRRATDPDDGRNPL